MGVFDVLRMEGVTVHHLKFLAEQAVEAQERAAEAAERTAGAMERIADILAADRNVGP